ncbi:MAG: flagellar assembly protein FliH [Spirochaetaceae bacterium]|nr:flagellar assembly protein FliH [Spirochaetaceae bacterium]
MAKSVFHPNEVTKKDDPVFLPFTRDYRPTAEEEEAAKAPVYEGPTAEDLKREAEEFKVQWEEEKKRMLEDAQAEAAEITRKAREEAAAESEKQLAENSALKAGAEADAAETQKEARDEADRIIREAREAQDALKKEAQDAGRAQGYDEGYQEGKKEADRLIGRLHTILDRLMERRQEILDETEQQVVDLVLLMARKVVKALSAQDREVVVSNVLEALKKVKGRGDVIIRVNMDDLEVAAAHKQEFVEAVEGGRNITLAEDSGVDKGGCLIETDFGAVDARIASQLKELEQKILELSPVKRVSASSLGEE